MATITGQQVDETMERVKTGVDGSVRTAAKRALKAWKMECSEVNLRLYLALKALCGEHGGTVQRHMMDSWGTKAEMQNLYI